MYLLLSDKELIDFLIEKINYARIFADIPIEWNLTEEYLSTLDEKYLTKEKFIPKFKERLLGLIQSDIQLHLKHINELIKKEKRKNFKLINENFNYFVQNLGKEKIIDFYLRDKKQNFVKSTGLHIDNTAKLIRRCDYTDNKKDCLFRNMDGNETMLLDKMNNEWPFWFIDTGYTNFLNGKNKIWHRLVKNNLHHSKYFEAPVDRLDIFESFPLKWRDSGEKILIIEPGEFSSRTFKVDIEEWKKSVINELKKYTDKKIVVREKLSKSSRTNLYKELCDDDYYCVININSNAATESIWAGVPAITLGKHITNSVTRKNISDINNLYRPHLAQWLCMISYSQFTYEELINGFAVDTVKRYHV